MGVNQKLFAAAKQYLPGGVNSPVRAFGAVGGVPVFMARAAGAYLFDTEGKRYIDYVGAWGPMILGHSAPTVIDAVQRAVINGLSFGAPTEAETQLAARIHQCIPSMEKLRFVNSGTEATMTAIRLARGATGRDKIIKFIGGYHGHVDSLLVAAGSGALTSGIPSSLGVPKAVVADTLLAQFNELDSVHSLFARDGDQIAAVIVEPIAGNMGCILPEAGFLEGLRALCDQHKSVLIFDEVMTGFRVARFSAQQSYGVTPDLTTLGKIIGGGMPVGALGGRAELMDQLAPTGGVYQAGTLSGNPVAMAAGLATLEALQPVAFYETLVGKTERLTKGLTQAAESAGIAVSIQQAGGLFGLFFSDNLIKGYQDVINTNTEQFKLFFHALLDQGVYWAPSAFESGFVSAAHSDADIDATIAAAGVAFVAAKAAV